MDGKLKFAVIYVLYNPDLSLLENSIIISKSQVDRVYLLDNSDSSDFYINNNIVNDVKISYIHFEANKGIAFALNFGCKKAIDEGYNWVVTFDQDSIPPLDLISRYSTFIAENQHLQIGALTLAIQQEGAKIVLDNSYSEVSSAITSGCCTSLSAFVNVNGFKEELFIDAVDHEFCLNIRSHNYKIFQLKSIYLQHKFGDKDRSCRIFNRTLFSIHCRSNIRYFYMVRNYLYVIKQYSSFDNKLCKQLKMELLKTLIKIPFLEENKISKIKASLKGYICYKRNKLGKYINE